MTIQSAFAVVCAVAALFAAGAAYGQWSERRKQRRDELADELMRRGLRIAAQQQAYPRAMAHYYTDERPPPYTSMGGVERSNPVIPMDRNFERAMGAGLGAMELRHRERDLAERRALYNDEAWEDD